MCGKIKACKQKLSELKKYENIIKKKKKTCKKIYNFFLNLKKKGNLETKRGIKNCIQIS